MPCTTTHRLAIEDILVLPHCADQMSMSFVGDIEQILDKALEV
jgi:hypothetical protein